MTFREIYELARDFIPQRCRKKIEPHFMYDYWPAHEIGHFLVANKAEIRREEYGLGIDIGNTRHVNRSIAHEIAAMHVSQAILRRISKRIADREVEDTDKYTLDLRDDPATERRVRKLLEANRIVDVPRTVAELRRALKRKRRALGLPKLAR